MSLPDVIEQYDSIFIDTAPIIYFIEAHPQYGALAKKVVDAFQAGKTIDAIQIAALEASANAFITNDKKLKNIKNIEIIILMNYL